MTKNFFSLLTVVFALFLLTYGQVENQDGKGSTRYPQFPVSQEPLTLDGDLDDAVWTAAPKLDLKPSAPGIPPDLAGNTRIVLRGNHLCLGTFCPEANGKVIAKSIGFNPTWERELSTSPELEDRIVYIVRKPVGEGKEAELILECNPWGAIRVQRDGNPVSTTKIKTAARITEMGWSVETAVPLEELDLGVSTGTVKLSVEQIRSRRPLAPEFRWRFPDAEPFRTWLLPEREPADRVEVGFKYDPPRIGNSEPALLVGYQKTIVPIEDYWNDPTFWDRVPGFHLQRNEVYPREPDYPTQIRWVHDGEILAVLFHCREDLSIQCNTSTRDGSVKSDDYVGIYLATSGSSLIEIVANPAGIISDSKITRLQGYRADPGSWDGNIKTRSIVESDSWMVRMDIPLAELAEALGETDIPQNWRILVCRSRPQKTGEPGELSTLPVIGNAFLLAPARYRGLSLSSLRPDRITPPAPQYLVEKAADLEGEIGAIDSHVMSRFHRKYLNLTGMLQRSFTERIEALVLEEQQDWEALQSLRDWKEFRENKVNILKASLGEFPETKCPLDYQVTGRVEGEGFSVQNVIFQSRPGFYVAANLYLPERQLPNMPGIIIIPGHHFPKVEGELKDCGMIWARSGCAVLVLENIGHGERNETVPWYRQSYNSEYLTEMQLNLIGQSRYGWHVWDTVRAVDLLHGLGNIDPERLILIGSVTWGGGPPAAVVGIFEERIDAVIPFNYGRVSWSGFGIRNTLSNKITPWFIFNAVAPRRLIYGHEFWIQGPAMVPYLPRYRKVYDWYGLGDNFEATPGGGLHNIRSLQGACNNIGPHQRGPLFPVLERWFGIPLPSQQDRNIRTSVRAPRDSPEYSIIKAEEARRRPADISLLSITPEASAGLARKPLHKIALEMGRELLGQARTRRSALDPSACVESLKRGLSQVLIDIEPRKSSPVRQFWMKPLSRGAAVEALSIESEPGILVPMLIIRPSTETEQALPAVVALSAGGKARFLKYRNREIGNFIRNGVTVCIPDVRGVGETAADQYNRSDSFANREMELGKNLLGLRLKDIRAVLSYLPTRGDVDPERIAVWGDSFARDNEGPIWVDELHQWPAAPQIQYHSSPLGAHLALLAALYHSEIRCVAVRGGLVGYLSVLYDNFAYVPPDTIVPGMLEAGDISDICAGLAPRPLLIEHFVGGRNFVVEDAKLREEMALVTQAYERLGHLSGLLIRSKSEAPELSSWVIGNLQN